MSDDLKDKRMTSYATDEQVADIFASRQEYMDQFNQELSPDDILSIAQDNYNAGIEYAMSQFIPLLDLSLQDYDMIFEKISPIMGKVRADALKKELLRKKQSEGGKLGASMTNSKHKQPDPSWQQMVDEISESRPISHSSACEIVGNRVGRMGSTIRKKTKNPRSKNKQ